MNEIRIVNDSIIQHAKAFISLCEYKYNRLQQISNTFARSYCNLILGSPPSDLHTMIVLPWCFHPTSLEK